MPSYEDKAETAMWAASTQITPGIFSPIEDVIREAEERAERQWRLEHEPCQHDDWLDITKLNTGPEFMCIRCGQKEQR